ncbi:low molecular weight protein-tyrosine-phosphatase [Caulobacter sp. NIBR2454]|uniref:low molecular weight protein-tyrosine-phosphatase n=1 Tax=Caulobacter sp. NIBR2454 TaxID=3015996 RepID=UPI0022B6FEC8|nr:low molecular weight protein-tyrosine-phosphatase [Caulobacter sp. NIBR2454]
MSRPSVLFVCLGNICRSPLAEAAFRAEAMRIGLEVKVDSAGTGDWHVGQPPDRRAQATALRNGVDISGYRGRQVTPEDFRRFTHIVAQDRDNLSNLMRMRPRDAIAELSLMLEHAGRPGESVADPYYGDEEDFDVTWWDVTRAAEGLARRLSIRD